MTAPLQHFNDELDRTAVISEDFKKALRAWAYEIARDAYERGIAAESRGYASDYEQVRTTINLLLSALRSDEGVTQAVEEAVAKGLGSLKRLGGKVEA